MIARARALVGVAVSVAVAGAVVVIAGVGALGCNPAVRFEDRAILWHWPDDRPVPLPARRKLGIYSEGVRDSLFAPIDRVTSLDYYVEAHNVNALDEVPDSAWFHDPRRVDGEARPRRLRSDEVALAALGPEDTPVLPFTVTEGKGIGATPGFVAKDARGIKYLVKLDPTANPGLTTSTELVVNRLAWASGWLVPALSLIDVAPSDVLLSEKAKTKNRYDVSVPYRAADLQRMLDSAPHLPDGRLRMLASRWLPGVSVGEFAYYGRVADDANDRVEHQDRRDLRGFGVFCAWVNNVDTLQNNTLDMYDGAPGKGHVVHYQQDIGGSFGNFAGLPESYWTGTETYFETHLILRSLLSLGLWPRVWDSASFHAYKSQLAQRWPELGNFEASYFEPRQWQPILENAAFVRQRPRDRYWGAKRIAAFDERELRAAVAAGRYRPEAEERLLGVLWERRNRIARAYFAESAALDHFTLRGRTLCFDDLWIDAGLGGGAVYRSETEVRDRCLTIAGNTGYRVIPISVQRAGERRPARPVRVHVILQSDGGHIVGIER